MTGACLLTSKTCNRENRYRIRGCEPTGVLSKEGVDQPVRCLGHGVLRLCLRRWLSPFISSCGRGG